jgi:serine/threonine protein kinase
MIKDLVRLSSWLRQAGFKEEAEEALGLDEDWLKEVGVDRDEEEKKLMAPEEKEEEPDLSATVYEDPKDRYNLNLVALKEKGIIPVHLSDKTLVGKGSYGSVYNVIYKGRAGVAKISSKDEYNDDVRVWSKILSLKERLDKRFWKHIPDIWGLFSEDKRTIVVMEKLQPMKGKYEDLRLSWTEGRLDQSLIPEYERVYSSEDFGNFLEEKLGEAALKELPKMPEKNHLEWASKIYPKENKGDLIKRLKAGGRLMSERESHVIWKEYLTAWWARALSKAWVLSSEEELSKEELSGEEIYAMKSLSREWMSNFFIKTINREEEMSSPFPEEASESTKRVSSDLESFLDFLKALDKEGVKWYDLREDNVMVRPSTGDLVLTDVGLFE